MSQLKKILILEDEFVIAENTRILLEECYSNIETEIAGDAEEASEILEEFIPDVALVDIRLGEGKTGIEFSEILNKKNIPFIFITAHGDQNTVSNAIKSRPLGYIVKPVNKNDLYVNLEMAYAKIIEKQIFTFKDGTHDVRIPENEIIYLCADGNYTEIHTTSKRYVVRNSMKKILEDIQLQFVQSHRSYFVNPAYIRETNDYIYLTTEEKLPLSRKYKKEVLNSLFKG